MIDAIPVHTWILLILALIAWGPAEYAYRYLREAPSKDLLAPPVESEWRDPGQFVRCLAVLIVLAGLAVFIFTTAAEQFAASGYLVPLIGAGVTATSLYEAAKGFMTGQVEPMVRGSLGPYSRDRQPTRFWLSIFWNLAIGIATAWMLIMSDFYIPNEA